MLLLPQEQAIMAAIAAEGGLALTRVIIKPTVTVLVIEQPRQRANAGAAPGPSMGPR